MSALIVMPHLTNPHSREISETTRLDAEQCQHKCRHAPHDSRVSKLQYCDPRHRPTRACQQQSAITIIANFVGGPGRSRRPRASKSSIPILRFYSLNPTVSECIVITDHYNHHCSKRSRTTRLDVEQSGSVAKQKQTRSALRPQRSRRHHPTTAAHVQQHLAATL